MNTKRILAAIAILFLAHGPARAAAPKAPSATPPSAANPLGGVRPCTVERFPAPVAAELSGFDFASCIAFEADRRLCKARHGDDPEVLLVFTGPTERWRWPSDGYTGDTADFALYRGSDEAGVMTWIVASRFSSSNGIGVETTDLFWLPDFQPGARPLALAVEDFGPSSLVQELGEAGCSVLGTEWFPDEDRRRGSGMYYGGHLYRPAGGHLEPVGGARLVARRLLDSFDAERGHDMFDGPQTDWALGNPLRWLSSPRAELRAHPRASLPVVTRQSGTIAKVRYDDDRLPPVVTVALAVGTEAHVRERYWPPESCQPSSHELALSRLGDSASGALFPQLYRPADTASLVGRPAELVTYRDPDASSGSCPPRILWVEPKRSE